MADVADKRNRVVGDGFEFDCAPGQSLLLSMEQAGSRAISVGCRGGGCGVCKIKVLSGEYRTDRMSRAHVSVEEEASGFALACRVYPEGDLEIRVVGKPDVMSPDAAPARM